MTGQPSTDLPETRIDSDDKKSFLSSDSNDSHRLNLFSFTQLTPNRTFLLFLTFFSDLSRMFLMYDGIFGVAVGRFWISIEV
jgi:hypothetical protein